MAVGSWRAANVSISAGAYVPSSGKGNWIVANDDAETAQSATELLTPFGVDDSTFHWVKVGPNATRVLMRAKQLVGATVTTSPVVRLIGAYSASDEAAFVGDGTERAVRLDNADANATGVTLTLASSGTGLMKDSVYAYSDCPDLTGYDLLGCNYVGVFVETAANVNTGTVPIELMFLN